MRGIKFYLAIIILSSLHFACIQNSKPVQSQTEFKPLTVFLVRHAEKTDASRDPVLSEEGKERALILANTLKNSGIEFIHSSDYIRTRETALPLANKLSVPIEIYNPRKLDSLADYLKQKRGSHLVVGHSNTTPDLVKLLGGEAGPEINEVNEYDRLYIVSENGKGSISTVLLRYGKPYLNGE